MLDFSALKVETGNLPDSATAPFNEDAEPEFRYHPAFPLYDLDHVQPEIPPFQVDGSNLTPELHCSLYRDLLKRNDLQQYHIVELTRIIEGKQDGNAMEAAIRIIDGLSKSFSSRQLLEAYQNRLR